MQQLEQQGRAGMMDGEKGVPVPHGEHYAGKDPHLAPSSMEAGELVGEDKVQHHGSRILSNGLLPPWQQALASLLSYFCFFTCLYFYATARRSCFSVTIAMLTMISTYVGCGLCDTAVRSTELLSADCLLQIVRQCTKQGMVVQITTACKVGRLPSHVHLNLRNIAYGSLSAVCAVRWILAW